MVGGTWRPDSWTDLEARQQPVYSDRTALEEVLRKIRTSPPVVVPNEVELLKRRLAQAARGEAFILQGGNCAERFIDCSEESIANTLKILLQMSVILTYGVRKPVVRIGRLAGQYAKPRSSDTETVDGRPLSAYRGDAVNSVEPNEQARKPDPIRLLAGYFHSVTTLNHIRALTESGFADLHRPYQWNVGSIEDNPNWADYREVVDRILDGIHYVESLGGIRPRALGTVEFFSSHEGLLLGYEEALTRWDADHDRHYALSAHTHWIGARTRQPEGAHVEFFRGVANPVGVKIDATCPPEEIRRLVSILNPREEEGRLILITRLGAGRVDETLPSLIRAVTATGIPVVWSCDPMHGNTMQTKEGRKTRDISVILDELTRTFRAHQREGTILAGVHFELTADDVTECVGGAAEITPADLHRRYETYCDPRLNSSQSLEMAFLIARLLRSP